MDHACCSDSAVPKNLGKPPAMQENAARTSNGGCGCKGAPSSPNANGKCHSFILNGKPSSPSPIAVGANSLSGNSPENLGRKGSSTSLDKQSSSIKNQEQLVHAYIALDSATNKGTGADCIDVKCCDKLATSLASNSLDKPASSKLETGHSSAGLENASQVIGHSWKEQANDSLQEKPARTNHVAEPTNLDEEAATESGLRT